MGIESIANPNLVAGVSQQPPSLRSASQSDEIINCYPSVANGLIPRPHTAHIAKVQTSVNSNAKGHLINRDVTQRYVAVVDAGQIRVFVLETGVECTVNAPSGWGYLTGVNPRTDVAMTTVLDFTFVVNRTKVVAMTAAVAPGPLTGTVQTFATLPGSSSVGQIYRIRGTTADAFDDSYVIRDASNVWIECAAPGVLTTLDAATMPHKLTRTGPTTFEFAPITWGLRTVGDAVSAPSPSFVGGTINDAFFYRNRLGFLSGENAVLSQSARYFDFFPQSVTAVLDSDPIDEAAPGNQVSVLRHAVPFNKTLLLFSENAQFQMMGGEALTPKSKRIDQITAYASNVDAKPVAAGQDVFFAVPQGGFTGLRQYFVQEDSLLNDALDTTAQVPRYIRDNVFHMGITSSDNALLMASLEKRDSLWLYKYLWSGENPLQTAWSRWDFQAGDEVLWCDFINFVGYVLIKRSGGLHLETFNLQEGAVDTGFTYRIRLDRRVSLTGVYDAVNDWTTWTLPYEQAGVVTVVRGTAFGTAAGVAFSAPTRPSNTTVRVTGNHSAGACFLGVKYTAYVDYSEQFMRDSKNVAIINGRLQLLRLLLIYARTAHFKVQVRASDVDYEYLYTSYVMGLSSAPLGTPTILNGEFDVPINCKSSEVRVRLINDSYLPSAWQSSEWLANYVPRANRR